jgi:hypothetical protein
VLVSLMGSSFLSELDDTSILRTGALHRYHYPLAWLPVSRLLLPRSGMERSDFVRWPAGDIRPIEIPWCSSLVCSVVCHRSCRDEG